MVGKKHQGLLERVEAGLAEGFVVKGERNYGTISKLQPVKRDSRVRNILDSVLAEHLHPEEVQQVKDGYINTSLISDEELMAPAFNKLAQKKARPLNREVFKRMLACKVVSNFKNGLRGSRQIIDLTAKGLTEVQENQGSASGIIPVRPVRGIAMKVAGKKTDMVASALSINIRDSLLSRPPPYIPVKPFLKEEVVKKGKPIRGIQNESYCNYMVLKKIIGDEPDEFHVGNAIGMGSRVNGYQIPFFLWFVKYNELTGKGWEQFIDYISQKGAHESDKVGWEASVNITDALVELVYDFSRKRVKTDGEKRIYLRAFADSYCPAIYLDRSAFFVPYRVPSGTVMTSRGNTKRHRSMNDFMCNFIARHDNKLGLDHCSCVVCST